VIEKIHHTIYKTINLINGKFYIGKHQTCDPFDNYLGSGKQLKQAIKKYGRKNFKKEILFDFETEEEMNQKEKEIITEDFVNSDDNYNLGIGGEGGANFKGKTHSEETKAKMKAKALERKLKGFTRPQKEETKEKISKTLSGISFSFDRRKNMSEGAKKRKWSPEVRKKISESMKEKHRKNKNFNIKPK